MIKEIKMPKLGTTTNEIKILNWRKRVNDPVKRGEILFEVETDKAVMEVESYLSGYLKKIVVEDAGIAKVGSTVAYIGEDTDVFETQPTEVVQEKLDEQLQVTKRNDDTVRISPMVKKIAEKLGVDYYSIEGTGANGTITKSDIENAANASGVGQVVLFDRIGRATAQAMTLSKTTIPHVYFSIEVNATAMMSLREASSKRITYNTMIIQASYECIKEYPYIAAKYSERGRILADKINIGLAVARRDDLLVPVIKDTGSFVNLYELEKNIQILTQKTVEEKLKQSDVTGGVFTVTNLGGFGIDSFYAVINPPEAAILAVGRIAEKAVVTGRKIEIQPNMQLTLSTDHRVVNGAYAARFLKALKQRLERIKSE